MLFEGFFILFELEQLRHSVKFWLSLWHLLLAVFNFCHSEYLYFEMLFSVQQPEKEQQQELETNLEYDVQPPSKKTR